MESTKSPKIFLYNHKQIVPAFVDGMYRASVEGRNYCSSSLSGLIDALGFFYSIYVTTDPIPEKIKPEEVLCGEVLASFALVESKQKAFKKLQELALLGNPVAVETVNKIKIKPLSFGASIVQKWAGVSDFAEVSPATISDMVGDIVHRSSLLKELGDRLSLSSFSSKE